MNTGAHIPQGGLGVWQMARGDSMGQAVTAALRHGYRHIDTARIYFDAAGVERAPWLRVFTRK
jgi:diketogulonate reductase-like aldo/keto reductase